MTGPVLLDRTAALMVEVYPIGQPGRVFYLVTDRGPEPLTRAEIIRALRAAADQIESNPPPPAGDWHSSPEDDQEQPES